MFFTPTLDSNWFIVQKASRYLMIILAIAMLAMPLLVQPKEADGALVVLGAIGAGIALGTLAANLWQNAWIDCPADCGGQVQRKEKDKHYKPCTRCETNLWKCIGSDSRPCTVAGCSVDSGVVWTCPTRPDGVDWSTEHLHGDGVCNDNDDGASSSNNSSNG